MDVEIFYQQMRSEVLERLKNIQIEKEDRMRSEQRSAELYVQKLQTQELGLRRRVLSSSAR